MHKRTSFISIVFLIIISVRIIHGNEIHNAGKLTYNQNLLVKFADSFLGKRTYSKVVVKKRTFILDCVGFVSAVYYGIGIDIRKDFASYTGNGVSRLFHSLYDKGMIYRDRQPAVGDIIFWDYSWDKNNDGNTGKDRLTHAGIVMQIDSDGTIHYIHANYVYGIVIETMNLKYPSTFKNAYGKQINSILALGSSLKKHPLHWLSGDMWNAYGTVPGIKSAVKKRIKPLKK
jgi:hypothetical protein